MKTLWVTLLLMVVGFRGWAQAPMQNIEGNVNAIVSKLNTALTLTDVQKPKLSESVSAFLNQRALILPLANDNPKAYDTKLKSMHNGFYRKVKSILTVDQYAQFLALKPVENDKLNVLSQLYY
jgi:hypothetical protein